MMGTYKGNVLFAEILNSVINAIKPKFNEALFNELIAITDGSDASHAFVKSAVGDASCIDQLSRRDYKKIRKNIIDAFKADDTEYGDLTDTLSVMLAERIPNPPLPSGYALSLAERIEWRDSLIKELDAMTAR